MKDGTKLSELSNGASVSRQRRIDMFAQPCLGMFEALSSGSVSAPDALRTFFHADNCLFIRKQLKCEAADELICRGVQLADLFDLLPPGDAPREFQKELAARRALGFRMLEKKLQVA